MQILSILPVILILAYVASRKCGDVTIKRYVGDGSDTSIYLIPGMNGRSEQVFKDLLAGRPKEMSFYLVDYQNTGFVLQKAADALAEHINNSNASKICIVAVSIGYQMAVKAATKCTRDVEIIALTPCVDAKAIKFLPNSSVVRRILIVACHIINILTLAIGYIPMVQADGGNYSLRLTMDQLLACLTSTEYQPLAKCTIVAGEHDDTIDPLYLRTFAKQHRMPFIEINAGHYGVPHPKSHGNTGPLFAEQVRRLVQ